MSTNVPVPVLSPIGYSIPEDAAILAGVQADINAAFGGGLNMSLSTPQGQLASSLAAIIADCYAQFLGIVNQTDPLYAQGRMQDALGAIYNIFRIPASPTLVSVTCNGSESTVIPAGVAILKDAAGNLYETISGGVISSSGTVTLTFSNMVDGEIDYVAPMVIYQTTSGWDSISSVTLTTTGRNVETQQEFEYRRQLSVSINSMGNLASIRAAILASGVNSSPINVPLAAYLYENATSSTVTIDSISMPANSVWIAVSGGDDAAIAQAIFTKKMPGTVYAVTPTYTTYDYSYAAPYPEYLVGFVRPTPTPLNFIVTLANNPPINAQNLVEVAIASSFEGTDGDLPVKTAIGTTVFASRFYNAIRAALPGGIAILSVKIGTGATPTEFSQRIAIDEIATQGTVSVVTV